MKKIFALILVCLACTASGQTFYMDQATSRKVCNVYLTDSANEFYNLHLKMHVDIYDHGDTVNGASFIYTLYTISDTHINQLNNGQATINGSNYASWDKSNDSEPYNVVRQYLEGQHIYIKFQ